MHKNSPESKQITVTGTYKLMRAGFLKRSDPRRSRAVLVAKADYHLTLVGRPEEVD
jgi:hypothetical protein